MTNNFTLAAAHQVKNPFLQSRPHISVETGSSRTTLGHKHLYNLHLFKRLNVIFGRKTNQTKVHFQVSSIDQLLISMQVELPCVCDCREKGFPD